MADQIEFAEGVLPETTDELAVPAPLDRVSSWHRPRKQYIRKNQWLRLVKTRILNRLDEGEFRYLTLPGMDMIDVDLISSAARDMGKIVTSTGFLRAPNPVIARASLRQSALIESGHLSPQSMIYPGALEELISESTQIGRQIRSRAPFHAINIDACGSIAKPDDESATRLVEAIYRLIEIQLRYAGNRWFLFLTIDARKRRINQEMLAAFSRIIRENCIDKPFSDALPNIFSEAATRDAHILDRLDDTSWMDESDFVRFFSLGITKYLIHTVQMRQWNIRMHPVYCYSTMQDQCAPTMPCLAFEFLPPPTEIPDRHQISRLRQSQETLSAAECALRAANKVAGMLDLDKLLLESPNLKYELSEETKNLLRRIGYPEEVVNQLDELEGIE